jgi:spore coat protein U-like protein
MSVTRKAALLLLLSMVALGLTPDARADIPVCQASSTGVNFGASPSMNASGLRSSAEIRVSCTSATAQSVPVCLKLNSESVIMRNGAGGELNAGLYRDSSLASLWQSQVWVELGSVVLDGKGSASLTAPLYAVINSPAALMSAGAYTAIQPLQLSYGATCSTGTGRTGSFTLQMLATINASCTIATRDLQFGTVDASRAKPIDVSTSISVTCTNTTPYSISIGPGLGGGVTGARDRKMKGPGGAELTYGLYTDPARLFGWDSAQGVSARATGSPQSHAVHGRVNPLQSAPAGVYRDTVVVTVHY